MKEGQRHCKGQSIRFAVRLCLLAISEAAPLKSHKHDYTNVSWTRITPINMPKQTKESP